MLTPGVVSITTNKASDSTMKHFVEPAMTMYFFKTKCVVDNVLALVQERLDSCIILVRLHVWTEVDRISVPTPTGNLAPAQSFAWTVSLAPGSRAQPINRG